MLNLIGKEKDHMLRLLKIYGKNESSILEIVKKEKKFVLVLLLHLGVMATVHDESLVKLEKALTEKDHIYITFIILLEFFLVIVAYCCSSLTVSNF